MPEMEQKDGTGASWLRIAPAAELPDGSAARLDLDGEPIAIFRDADELFALDAECLHMGGPLEEGEVEAGVVVCPWHGWRYDLCSGERLDRVGSPLRTFSVRVRDGWIELNPKPGRS
jgi:nitrite reductase/ring-hydroxylating ferredoxin subunit